MEDDQVLRDASEASSNRLHIHTQLMLAKYLYGEGVKASAVGSPFAGGLAVSLFHDAAELMLACVAHALDADVRPDIRFHEYWQAIPKARRNKDQKTVPNKLALGRLNTARVAFKHHGRLPNATDVDVFRIDTAAFLKATAATFLEIDFDDVSLADLIANTDIREAIKSAEQALVEGHCKDGFERCALAASHMPDPIMELTDPTSLDRIANAVRDIDLGRQTQLLRDAVAHLANRLAVHDKILLRMLGHDQLRKREAFRRLTPRVVQFSGRTELRWSRRIPADPKVSEEELRFCIDYVVERALAPKWPLIPRI